MAANSESHIDHEVDGGNLKISNSRQRVSLYDAVAGRISSAGFIPKHAAYASTRDTPSTSSAPVAPEAVLFRRKNAPTRYAEDDIYFANERKLGLDLPDSDLLKALHCYAADFYARNTVESEPGDWKSMDETALLAMGILMEEASQLSTTGDLVFTEGESVTSLDTRVKPRTVHFKPSKEHRNIASS